MCLFECVCKRVSECVFYVLDTTLGNNRGLKKNDTEKRENKRLLVWRTVLPVN